MYKGKINSSGVINNSTIILILSEILTDIELII